MFLFSKTISSKWQLTTPSSYQYEINTSIAIGLWNKSSRCQYWALDFGAKYSARIVHDCVTDSHVSTSSTVQKCWSLLTHPDFSASSIIVRTRAYVLECRDVYDVSGAWKKIVWDVTRRIFDILESTVMLLNVCQNSVAIRYINMKNNNSLNLLNAFFSLSKYKKGNVSKTINLPHSHSFIFCFFFLVFVF